MNTLDLILITTFFLSFTLAGVLLGFWVYFQRLRRKDEEYRSLNSVLLLVRVQRGNEIKPDAMEQLIASLASLKKSGWKNRFKAQATISFEIVAKQEDI